SGNGITASGNINSLCKDCCCIHGGQASPSLTSLTGDAGSSATGGRAEAH
nr:hypothetical protein [Tanacetum cinerariifolium]